MCISCLVYNHAEDESLSMKLIEIGISKELLQVEHTECQQAMDILMLLLGKGDNKMHSGYAVEGNNFFQMSVWKLYLKMEKC